MQENILDTVRGVIAKMFLAKKSEIERDTVAADVNGWDSLSHTFLIIALEEKLGIKFDPYTLQEFSCVGDMVDEIERLKK